MAPTRNRLTPGTETEAGASISQARLELGQGLSPERRALQLQMQSTSWQLQNSMHQTASSTTQGLKGPCPAPRRPQQRQSATLPPALQNCNGERCVTQPVAGTPEPPLPLRKVTRLMTPFPHHFLLPWGGTKGSGREQAEERNGTPVVVSRKETAAPARVSEQELQSQ